MYNVTATYYLKMLIPLWTWAIALTLWWWGRKKPWTRWSRTAATTLALAGLFPILPSPFGTPSPTHKPARQIVYRFDDHRYLELRGNNCEGAVDYVDASEGIRTVVVSQFWRVFLPRFIHADHLGDIIVVPYEDGSAFEVSKDGGRSFETANWVGSYPDGFPGAKKIAAVIVAGQQAFIKSTDGRLFMTSRPFGDRWGLDIIDTVNVLPNKVHKDLPQFQNLPKSVPAIRNYAGWTEMHCDPDLQGEEIIALPQHWPQWQSAVLTGLGNTVALPITLAVRAFVRTE